MNIKIPEFLKRPFAIALWVILLGIFLLMNRWGVDFAISFHFKSAPIEKVTPANPALKTQVTYPHLAFGHRDSTT